ncbi:PREDICTED: UPF0481 protein At3g47200-like [Nicotiana attenuata]|uniref:UPF0481 protein At3g47200-like n=1 Tax=Nicotiana attenuata TaxID=49451 RepID=UPI0009055CB5|nr:PREDICTED: UPF0481 protein At3g47200-like [Nicotiana attenuata]
MENFVADHNRRCRANEVLEWLHSATAIHDPPIEEEYTIRAIPSTLIENTSAEDYGKYYEPHVVSIGPIHHRKPLPQAMKLLKRKAPRELAGRVSIQHAHAGVEQDLLNARNCYSPSHTECYADDRDWCLMLFLDGCFIILFIRGCSLDMLNMKKHDRDLVCRDLLLFENQLPFQLLHALLRAFEIEETFFLNDTGRFLFNQLLTISPNPTWNTTDYDIFRSHFRSQMHLHPAHHLLQIFREIWIKFPFFKEEEDLAICEPLSVTELKKMGIRCSSNNQQYISLSLVQLKSFVLSGTLFLPRLTIHEWTKTLLLNLVAFEFSSNAQDKTIGVWSYLNLMNMLIQGEEDVKELRARGTLQLKSVSNVQEVVNLLRYITARGVPNHRAYGHVKRYIFTYSKSKVLPVRVLLAELKHRYFHGPWSFLLFLAVLFTVTMTVIQTLLTEFRLINRLTVHAHALVPPCQHFILVFACIFISCIMIVVE